MTPAGQTFQKPERLCSISLISGLFEEGEIFYNSIFKVVWSESPIPLPYPAQVAFSVSKRSFRHAVSRNLIKRRMREAYRKNKSIFYDALTAGNRQLIMVIIMKAHEIPDYETIEKAMTDVLRRLAVSPGKKRKEC